MRFLTPYYAFDDIGLKSIIEKFHNSDDLEIEVECVLRRVHDDDFNFNSLLSAIDHHISESNVCFMRVKHRTVAGNSFPVMHIIAKEKYVMFSLEKRAVKNINFTFSVNDVIYKLENL